ncbi:MAG: hypothetical protein HOD68_00270, partial [Flavobacteriales bacterium]|nr:hypothetical protein [Flavobacteriales bacterium]
MKKLLFLFFFLSVYTSFSQNCNNLILSAGSDITICVGDSIALGGTPTASWANSTVTPTYSYNWIGNGLNDSTANPYVSPLTSTIYTLTVSADAGFGVPCVDTISVTISVQQLPVLNLTPFSTFCEDESQSLLIGGDPFGGTYSGSGVNNNIFDPSFASIGNNTITYTYIDSNGCSNSTTDNIIVYALPSTSLALTSSQSCSNETPFQLDGGLPTGGNYSGPGVNNNIFYPSNANISNNTITYSYIDTNGCSNSATDNIAVNLPPVVSFSITNQTQFCSNETPFQLVGGSPAGGTYSGPGVNNNIFYPSNANIGNNTITYTYLDNNGCSNSATQIITIIEAPYPLIFPDQNGNSQTSFIWDFQNSFTSCGGFDFDLALANTSATSSTDSIYTIDWGDNSAIDVFTSTQLDGTSTLHTYTQQGLFNLNLTVLGQNGCSSIQTIPVFNGTNPAITLGNPGSTVGLCVPENLLFPITGTSINPPGTEYTITTNTGLPSTIFSHPPPSSYTHYFETSSCGASGGIIPNSYFVEIKAENPCGISYSTVEPITTGYKPVADINITPGDSVACVNSNVTFENISIEGVVVNNNGVCNYTNKSEWQISPNNGWIVQNGSLGNINGFIPSQWGSQIIEVEFTNPGVYQISLIVKNNCGFDTTVQSVCIVPQPDPSFSLNTAFGCVPANINTNNNSNNLADCFPTDYLWNIQQTNSSCGYPSSWSFTNSSVSTDLEPSMIFNNPGEYNVELTATNKCNSISYSENIIIAAPPQLSINYIPNFCDTADIYPILSIDDCLTPINSYQWNFPNGAPVNSNNNLPGPINYNQAGSYTISLDAFNVCGSGSATQSFNIYSSTTSSTLPVMACDSYTWNGNTYTQSGNYSFNTTNSNNCDSTAYLNLIINPSTSSTTTITACDSLIWNGNTYTQSGNYSFNTTNSNNC